MSEESYPIFNTSCFHIVISFIAVIKKLCTIAGIHLSTVLKFLNFNTTILYYLHITVLLVIPSYLDSLLNFIHLKKYMIK